MGKSDCRVTKICGVVSASDDISALHLLRKHASYLDCAELRLDYLQQPNEDVVERLVKQSPVPVIATLRPVRHGGCFSGEEQLRFRLLRKAFQSGAFAIDLEEDVASAVFQDFASQGASVIASYHNFTETPDSIQSIFQTLRYKTNYCVKIATMVNSLSDLLQLYSLQSLEGLKIIVGMGAGGLITRVLAGSFGSMLTFGVLDREKPTAPGQIHVEDMVKLYRIRDISDKTKIYGVLGWPISQSLSPLLHNVCFSEADWDAVYIAMGAPSLDGLRELGELLGFKGFSVTHPHKQRATFFCDRIDASVSRAGASNTIVVKDGVWEAWNTDLVGFMRPLQKRHIARGIHAVVFGGGGAANAAVAALSELRANVTVVSRNREKGEELAGRWKANYSLLDSEPTANVELLVNATPLGMDPKTEGKPCDLRRYQKGRSDRRITVYDMVYNPKDTLWIQEALQLGWDVIYGQEMFIEQAAEQFRLWTQKEMDKDLALRVISEALLDKTTFGKREVSGRIS
jgi:3-dehydroquinate dehydratase / shikimate dehydrogenase